MTALAAGERFGVGNGDTDFRAVSRAALKDLNERLTAAVQQTKDPMTLAHLKDCRQEIEQVLYPRLYPRRLDRVAGDGPNQVR